jgi:protein-tyrosine phosphatase
MSAGSSSSVSAVELYNLLQQQPNWPSGGAPAVLDVRPDGSRRRVIRGSHAVSLTADGTVIVAGKKSLDARPVCLYDARPERLVDHPVAQALLRDGTRVLTLSSPFESFEKQYPFLCAKETSSKASKRPLMPSCIIPDLLYLGDLSDAAALPRLSEHLHIQTAVTALAELPPSLRASVAESKVEHIWCNVRDVEEADIKAHFGTAFAAIENAREQGGHAVFVHCSRGVSRSASLCIAYLMCKEGLSAKAARARVERCRPVILPNDGFWKCLCEYEKELTGERSGVYVPAPKPKGVETLDFELPPEWAAEPTHARASLSVEKGGTEVESLPVGEHSMVTFGRSLTCDFPLEHPSISRNHAALVHHHNGGLYVIDLKSSHQTFVNSKAIRPFEACLLREGAALSFGASSRVYRLRDCPPPQAPPPRQPAPACGGGGSSSSMALLEGPQLPGAADAQQQPKRKYTPADAKAKKRQKWLSGAKSTKQMTENERVARAAGGGSGCFGPGFD